ncbi:hypothetical protein [Actinoplanes sp. CA-252034]|uniref:hypothetical protein n=1 Tax=Actinoplanes sp. CA-252034 TaxID=3239906 RepID=UPI003D97537A
MSEHEDLIAELRELGTRLAVPPAVDQRTALRERLATPAPRPRRARRWWAAAAAALIATVAAVAPARAAVVEVVGDLLRVAGVEVRREQPRTTLPGTPAPLPSATASAAFPVGVPAALGEPEEVLRSDPDDAGRPRVVTLIYRGGAVRMDVFDGRLDTTFFKTAPDARFVDLPGSIGAAWLPGPHPVTYVGRDGVERTGTARLAGPTLVWATDTVTYRLEGIGTLEEAIAVARSVR